MRLLRLFFRIVLPTTLVMSSVVWLMCLSAFVMIRIPLPAGELHLRADHEGWLLQHSSTQFGKRPAFEFRERHAGTGDWHDWMQDINPCWVGSACVYAAWQNKAASVVSRFQIWGVKHYVVVLVSATAVSILIRCESWRNAKTRTTDRGVEFDV